MPPTTTTLKYVTVLVRLEGNLFTEPSNCKQLYHYETCTCQLLSSNQCTRQTGTSKFGNIKIANQ